MRTFLDRLIPLQPGCPVEVGIVTGKVSETTGLHGCLSAGHAVPRAAVSGRSVSRDSRYAVEIGIGAGKIGKSMDAHRCNDQRIVMQKASLLTGFGGEIQPGRVDGEDPDGEQGDFLNGLTKSRQRLHLGWMVSKSASDAGRRPAERLHRLDRHQSMSNFTEYMRGRDADNLLVFDALEEFGGGRPYRALGSKWWMKTLASRKTVRPAGKSA